MRDTNHTHRANRKHNKVPARRQRCELQGRISGYLSGVELWGGYHVPREGHHIDVQNEVHHHVRRHVVFLTRHAITRSG